jgi:hypothetical protein
VPQVTAAIHDFRHPPEAAACPYNCDVPSGKWLNAAAVVTWLICGLPPIAAIAGGESTGWPAAIFIAAFALFGAALVASLYRRDKSFGRRNVPTPFLVFVQSITGLTMTYLGGTYLGGTGATSATLVIVAAQLPYVVRAARVWSWIGLQTLVLAIVLAAG